MVPFRHLKLIQYRLVFIIAVQLGLASVSLLASFILRFDLIGVTDHLDDFIRVLPYFLIVKLISFYFFDLYRGWWRYAGMSDLLDIIKASLVSIIPIYLLVTFVSGVSSFSRTIYLLDALTTVAVIGGVRFVVRLYTESVAAQTAPTSRNLIIIGAGNTGRHLVREIRQNPTIELVTVGFLDDEGTKVGGKVEGVRVLGKIESLPALARELKVREVLIALPSATGEEMSRVVSICQTAGVSYKTVPAIGDLINGRLSLSQVREVKIEDLLGRQVVDIESHAIRRALAARSVLITGAGGSIGSELARQVAEFGPGQLILFERSENDLYHIELELRNLYPRLDIVPVAGDILDGARLEEIFQEHQPSAVLHAAAYKHVPMMERQPFVAVQNNVFGSYNVARVAAKYDAESFLLISTDKAVNPTSIMGVTKRLAELAVLSLSGSARTRFSAVRFGNVLGSNGSVVPLFKEQIAARQPVTVTDPDVTRYFMTIPEAVRLVLQASTMGHGGDVFILDMGRPVKIIDLARNLIRLSGLEPERDIPIIFTGLRPGEKRFEELLVASEGIEATSHAKVFQLKGDVPSETVMRRHLDAMTRVFQDRDLRGLAELLSMIVPEYVPSPEFVELANAEAVASRAPVRDAAPSTRSRGRRGDSGAGHVTPFVGGALES